MDTPQQVDRAFYEHLIAEDELGMVVRAHIHIEASIVDFLKQVVPKPNLLPRLPYEAKIRLACALGLDHDHFPALKALGDIRNNFGHDLKAQLTDDVVKRIFQALPEFSRAAAIGAYGRILDTGIAGERPPFESLSARDRFVLIAVVLKMFAVHAAAKAHFAGVDA